MRAPDMTYLRLPVISLRALSMGKIYTTRLQDAIGCARTRRDVLGRLVR
jgi:hypothetical protein